MNPSKSKIIHRLLTTHSKLARDITFLNGVRGDDLGKLKDARMSLESAMTAVRATIQDLSPTTLEDIDAND